MIENEYLGFDSKKLDHLHKNYTSNYKFPDVFDHLNAELKQTIIFINNKSVNGKAEFMFSQSLYPHFVYGDKVKETQKFYLLLLKTVKEIFGYPFYDHQGHPFDENIYKRLYDDNYWQYSVVTIFDEYVTRNDLKELSIKEVYEQKNKFGRYDEYFVENLIIPVEKATFPLITLKLYQFLLS